MSVRARMTALVVAFVLLLGGCGFDSTPAYRYRLTVEVETPEGRRSGSSVIEVDTRAVRSAMDPGSVGASIRLRGEAVTVDLGERGMLFALLRSDNDIDWAGRIMLMLAPDDPDNEEFIYNFDDMLALEGRGQIVVPRTFPPVGPLEERSAYPMLVTFTDESDPTSVALVDPDDLSATFGEGVELKQITVEMTNDAVTTGIEERLGWLSEHPEPSLKPDHALDDYSLAATLKHRAFRQGELK